ncbi:MAG: 4-alpha-glucanotransferase [Clostridia bacterium]|nr:4-alpha-glucanotransferase [Clostridia bacterium]
MKKKLSRASGVLMHVSSLWGGYSEGSLGKAAREWVDFLAEGGFRVWQVLPFCLPDDCNSPYKSTGAFSLNPNFIDLPTLAEQGLLTKAELEAARERTPYACEFDRLRRERFALLRRAATRLTDRRPMEKFLAEHPQTDVFCRFMAQKEANDNREWAKWTTDTYDPDTLLTWQFTQYECYRQWQAVHAYAREKGVSVVGDLPIYVAYDSADVWANRKLFQLDERQRPTAVAGVPPDYFSADGQLWGNPLYDWNAMKRDGYAWWRERMQFMLELFDGVRIDHFRAFEAYYGIPANETTAKHGKWVKGPGMDLIRAIRPICRGKRVIAEDLGVITDEVRALVEESGFPGMRVLQFGFLGDANSPHLPHNYPENCVAYTGTHDNNTLLGFVWDLDPNSRARLLDYCGFRGTDWDRSYPDILRTMFASHAGLLILPVQDLLLYGNDTRLNIPGRSEGNWAYRLKREQLNEVDLPRFQKWNRLYGRNG